MCTVFFCVGDVVLFLHSLSCYSLRVSCRLESAYIYNSRDSSKSQSSHFHHSNLLCPIVTRETVVSSSSDIETQATSSSVAVDKEDNVHAGSGSSSLWCCHDDRSVLPSSRCHLFGRPLEVAGISCKVCLLVFLCFVCLLLP